MRINAITCVSEVYTFRTQERKRKATRVVLLVFSEESLDIESQKDKSWLFILLDYIYCDKNICINYWSIYVIYQKTKRSLVLVFKIIVKKKDSS